MSTAFEGRYIVRRTPAAKREAGRLFPRARDNEELRRHALSLIWFPNSSPAPGMAVDLDYDAIRGMDGVFELRIDQIGQVRNIRLIFHVAEALSSGALPVIWVLSVFAKKSMAFRASDLARFSAVLRSTRTQFYTNR